MMAAVGIVVFVAIGGYLVARELRVAQGDRSPAAATGTRSSPELPAPADSESESSLGVPDVRGFNTGEPTLSKTLSGVVDSQLDEQAVRARPAAGGPGVVVGSGHANWCDLFQFPDTASDRLAQALVGDVVRVRQHQGAWSEVESGDGVSWSGWIPTACVARGQVRFMRQMTEGPWLVVVAAPVLHTSSGNLPFGAVLPDVSEAGRSRVRLPDGRMVSVDSDGVRARGSIGLDEALKRARQFLRAPYQRGANTVEAMDAAGLVQLVFRIVGRTLPRAVDALQRAGQNVPLNQMRAGDVIFFGTFDENHPHAVILLDGGTTFLEASPASGVNVGLVEQMRNRSIVAVRRYISPPQS